jgi:putative membrane protein
VTIRWLLAALHLLALAIGMESVWARGRAFAPVRSTPTASSASSRTTTGTGSPRCSGTPPGLPGAFFGFEKGTGYYLHQPFFVAKLALVVIVGAVEMWVMVVLIRWRRQQQRGEAIDTRHAALMSRISAWETFAIMLIIFLATAAARNVRFS